MKAGIYHGLIWAVLDGLEICHAVAHKGHLNLNFDDFRSILPLYLW